MKFSRNQKYSPVVINVKPQVRAYPPTTMKYSALKLIMMKFNLATYLYRNTSRRPKDENLKVRLFLLRSYKPAKSDLMHIILQLGSVCSISLVFVITCLLSVTFGLSYLYLHHLLLWCFPYLFYIISLTFFYLPSSLLCLLFRIILHVPLQFFPLMYNIQNLVSFIYSSLSLLSVNSSIPSLISVILRCEQSHLQNSIHLSEIDR